MFDAIWRIGALMQLRIIAKQKYTPSVMIVMKESGGCCGGGAFSNVGQGNNEKIY